MKKIVTSFEPQYNNSDLKIYSNLTPNVEVLMDMDKLKQVMYNLLSNSLKYSKINGEVKLLLEIVYKYNLYGIL